MSILAGDYLLKKLPHSATNKTPLSVAMRVLDRRVTTSKGVALQAAACGSLQ